MSVMASDRVQLTQDQITVRQMEPDGPVHPTKGFHVKHHQVEGKHLPFQGNGRTQGELATASKCCHSGRKAMNGA